jgi:uncharacterized membrane protein YeaQ/YmgE (transglycosylase-associated protein family)
LRRLAAEALVSSIAGFLAALIGSIVVIVIGRMVHG